MNISAIQQSLETVDSDCLVLLVNPKRPLSAMAARANRLTNNQLQQLIDDGDLGDSEGNHSFIHRPANMQCKRLMLFHIADDHSLPTQIKKMLVELATRSVNARVESVTIALADFTCTEVDRSDQWQALQLSLAILHSCYRFHDYKTTDTSNPSVTSINFLTEDSKQLEQYRAGIAQGSAIGAGNTLTRNLGNQPANICNPTYLRDCAIQLATDSASQTHSISTSYLDQSAMQEKAMGSLLSVSHGSDTPPYLICMQYHGAGDDSAPYALVGKGVTFDTGGISLKPGAGMDEMKYDMCGAATVLGVMRAVVEMQLPINLVGVVAAVENMPSGRASRPGDIVTSMSGKTIEILNTDAEGRLILCDALTYTQQQYKPKLIIDIATLTGACVIALGNHASGLYSNRQQLADDLLEAGELIEDRAWQMPLWSEYTAQLKSPFADLANIGGKEAGSVTAACFLAEFCKDSHWAHIDIAGTAWKGGTKKTATGRPTSMLCQYLISQA